MNQAKQKNSWRQLVVGFLMEHDSIPDKNV